MANLNFKWGVHSKLPTALAAEDVGSLFFTKDEGSLYLGVEAGQKPKRIQGIVQYYADLTAFKSDVLPPYSSDVIYYIASENALVRWDGQRVNADGEAEGRFVVLNVTASEFDSKVTELSASITGNTNTIAGVRGDLGTKDTDEKAAFEWLRTLQTSVDALNELTGLGSGEGASLTEQLAALVGRLDDEGGLVDRIEALEAWKTEAASDILDHEGRITTLETWKTNTVTGALTDLDSRLDSAESRLDAIDGTNGTIAAANSRIDGLASRMTTVEGTVSQHSKDILALQAKDGTIESSITDLQNDLTAATNRITPLETTVGSHATEITNIKNVNTEQGNTLKTHGDDIAQLKVDTLAIKNTADSAAAAIGNNTTEGTVKYRIAKLEENKTLVEADIQNIESDIEEIKTAIGTGESGESITGRLDAVEAAAEQAGKDIVAINNTLSAKADKSTVETLSGTVNDLVAADETQDGLISDNKTAIENVVKSIGTSAASAEGTVYGAIKAVDTKTIENANAIAGVKATAESADGKADTNAADIVEINKAIESIGEVDETQNSAIDGLKGRMDDAESNITQHGQDILALQNEAKTFAKQSDLAQEIADREAADTKIREDLNAEILSKIHAANSLTYINGISSADDWNAVKVKDAHIGDTYVVSNADLALNLDLDNNASTATVKCYAGDLLIATAKEGATETNGVLAAADIVWVHVESGYKAELQGKLNVVDGTNNDAIINLTSLNGNGTAGDLGKVILQSATPNLSIEAADSTVTFNLVWDSFE